MIALDKLSRREIILCILLLALGVRALYFQDFSQSIYSKAPNLDAAAYDIKGQAIAFGFDTQSKPYFQDPFYPQVLAVIYKLFGHSYNAVYLIQNLFGIILCLVIYQLASLIFENQPHRGGMREMDPIGWTGIWS